MFDSLISSSKERTIIIKSVIPPSDKKESGKEDNEHE